MKAPMKDGKGLGIKNDSLMKYRKNFKKMKNEKKREQAKALKRGSHNS